MPKCKFLLLGFVPFLEVMLVIIWCWTTICVNTEKLTNVQFTVIGSCMRKCSTEDVQITRKHLKNFLTVKPVTGSKTRAKQIQMTSGETDVHISISCITNDAHFIVRSLAPPTSPSLLVPAVPTRAVGHLDHTQSGEDCQLSRLWPLWNCKSDPTRGVRTR